LTGRDGKGWSITELLKSAVYVEACACAATANSNDAIAADNIDLRIIPPSSEQLII
jgi:hypothetical protein